MNNDQTRQLAAIMFADIVGYTAMMQQDEALTMKLRDKFKNSLEAEVIFFGGKVIKFSGDGVLCSFDSAYNAVQTAVAVQKAMQLEPKVPLRIGIHQGDVIFADSDVYGDGVNIASRLESLAIPGSIFFSAKVYDDIKNHKDIQSVSLGKYSLKNVVDPIEIFAVNNDGIIVPDKNKLEGKGVKYHDPKFSKSTLKKTLAIIVVLSFIGISAYLMITPWMQRQKAKAELLPAIQKLVDDNFRPPTLAFDLATEAEKYIPADSTLTRLWPLVSTSVSITTDPAGAEIFWKDYDKPDLVWRSAGITPLKEIKFPRGYLRMEIRKPGYQTIEYAGPVGYEKLDAEIQLLKLDKEGSLPENMIRIPANETSMFIVGLEHHGGKLVGEFLIDRHEVTNGQYKVFLDSGGYTNKLFWKHPVLKDGKEIPLEEALKLFIDKTGRPGPAIWEAGNYPDGQQNHPVSGVSWYEAAAYAEFVNKKLPTIFHWGRVAETPRTQFIVPLSNFNGKSTIPVGSQPGYCSFGVYDLAGNVREWCRNESSTTAQRFILGGGFNDPTYSFNDSYTQPALDRSLSNGFRCMKELPNDTTLAVLAAPVAVAYRDYKVEKPVDDKTFEIFINQYSYDKSPLKPEVVANIESDFWTAEKITFDAGYNNERMEAYLYLPKNGKPPYQTVLFFPGSGDIYSKKYDPESITGRIDFILKSGRAIIRPIYKGTHERHDELNSDLPEPTVFYKDHVIMWRKDIGRTIDYLETRKDIQSDKIGFLGWSWGGFMGGVIPAIEKRIKVIVLNVGGMAMTTALPEADQINFLPRVTQPVLMLNGKHDMFFPIETSQKPMFNLLGSPKADKKMIVYDVGHLVPRLEFYKETLLWYDKYLGEVK